MVSGLRREQSRLRSVQRHSIDACVVGKRVTLPTHSGDKQNAIRGVGPIDALYVPSPLGDLNLDVAIAVEAVEVSPSVTFGPPIDVILVLGQLVYVDAATFRPAVLEDGEILLSDDRSRRARFGIDGQKRVLRGPARDGEEKELLRV